MAGTAALKGWKDDYQHKLVTAEEAAAQVKSGDWIIVPPVNSVPIDILNALAARKDEIQKVKIASNLMIYPLRSWGRLCRQDHVLHRLLRPAGEDVHAPGKHRALPHAPFKGLHSA